MHNDIRKVHEHKDPAIVWETKNGENALNILSEQYTMVFTEQRKTHRVEAMLKHLKNPTDVDLNALKTNLYSGMEEFSAKFFEPLGGASLQAQLGSGSSSFTAFREGMVCSGKAESSSKKDENDKNWDRQAATDALTVKVKDESKPIVAELTHTLTSMRAEFNKLTPEDKTSAEYTEVVGTYKWREVSLLITLENMDGQESVSKFCEYCFQQVDLSCEGQQLINADLEVVAQFQELREKWSSAFTENNKSLPFSTWDKFGTVSTFIGSAWIGDQLASDITKKQVTEVKKAWDEFKKMIQLYIKGLMFAANQCSGRKTALANKSKNDEQKKQKEEEAKKQADVKKRRREEDQAEKSARKKIQAEAKKEAKDNKGGSKSGSEAWPVFTLEFKHHNKIIEHKYDGFNVANVDLGHPFIIKDVDTKWFEDSESYTVYKVWCNGFGHDEACKKTGRATWNLDKVLQPHLLTQVSTKDKQVKTRIEPYDNLIYSFECFGNMAQCRTNGTEPQSVNSMRLQLSGKRHVLAFRISGIMQYMQTEKDPKEEKPNTVAMGNFMKFMEQKDLDALRVSDALAQKKSVFHAVVSEKSMVYMPTGWWVVDRVISATPVFGLRSCCLLTAGTDDERKSLAAIVEMAEISNMKGHHVAFFRGLQVAADKELAKKIEDDRKSKEEGEKEAKRQKELEDNRPAAGNPSGSASEVLAPTTGG